MNMSVLAGTEKTGCFSSYYGSSNLCWILITFHIPARDHQTCSAGFAHSTLLAVMDGVMVVLIVAGTAGWTF
jgi:hypothetical protein